MKKLLLTLAITSMMNTVFAAELVEKNPFPEENKPASVQLSQNLVPPAENAWAEVEEHK